jgi:hypothetical protein
MKCPWISGDGLRLYGSTSSSLYWVPIQMGAQPPWRMLPAHLNSTPTQRSPCESPGGDTLYFISAPREDAEGYGDLDVYYSVMSDTGWGQVFNAGPNVNSPEREWSVSVSRDGTLLVVTSDRDSASYGSHDLFYHEKQTDGTWGEAINFGPNVNTYRDEENGSLSPNNDRLFFYTLGPYSGNVWESRMVEGQWQTAVSLPEPVNSMTETEMDPCIAIDGRTLWYRKGVTFPISFQIYTTVDTTVLDAYDIPAEINSFSLLVYPNPFNSANTITLSIPSYDREVDISIINSLGQIVNRETVRAAGGMAYYVNDMSGFASGVYFVQARAGEYAAAKKIVLMK